MNLNKETVRAACKKCGYAGHLTYQCRNFLKVSLIFPIFLFFQEKMIPKKHVLIVFRLIRIKRFY